ncbi:hypothetical protein KC318_g17839, partial [Hortaea werneckii]
MERETRFEQGGVLPVCMVAGNKCDLQAMRQISAKDGLQWAKGRGYGFMETSAREMVNIEETFALLVRKVVASRAQHARGEPQELPSSTARTQPLTPLQADTEKELPSQPQDEQPPERPKKQRWWQKLKCCCNHIFTIMDSTTALRNNSSAVTSRRNSYELGDFETGQQWSEHNHEVQTLPRADGGKDAWSLLGACFLLEALVWGFPFSFGIFQDYYINKNLFEGNEGGITAIGTTATGLMYFAAPFVAVAGQRWPQYRRPTMWTGAALIVLSLIGASFCNTVAGLLATEGVLYAIGGVITYFPAIQYIDEWFIMKKGLAYGVVWAGTGSAGIVVPFFSQWLLDSFGFRTTLRVWAIILAVMMTPALYFIKGRVPVSGSSALRPVDLGYMKRAAFWVFWISIMFEGLGYFVPTYWLPSFARSLNVPSFVGPLGLALYNVAVVVGAVSMGALVDHCHAGTAML